MRGMGPTFHFVAMCFPLLEVGEGAQRPNREIVSFRSCVRARGDCQVEMSLKRDPRLFPFPLWPREALKPGFPFPLGVPPPPPTSYPALAGFIGMQYMPFV